MTVAGLKVSAVAKSATSVGRSVWCVCQRPPPIAKWGVQGRGFAQTMAAFRPNGGMQIVGLRMHGVRGEGGYGLHVGGHVAHAWPMG